MLSDVIDAVTRAVAQLPEKALRWPLLITIFWTTALMLLLWWGAYHEFRLVEDHLGAYATAAAIAGIVFMLLVTWFGFVAVENTILLLYADRIVDAVIARHYPGRPVDPPARLGDLLWSGFRLTLVAVVGNLVALPFYVFVPGINLVLFLAVNGYVLGRGYFDVVALRRMNDRAARAVWRVERGAFIVNGAVAAFLMTVPVVNLLVPIVGLAASVHLLERRGQAASPRDLIDRGRPM
jgi:uncharacterized protein involved in cysteine biosynthesis